jgi:hypothetical protein
MRKLCASLALATTLLYSGLSAASWFDPYPDEDMSNIECPSTSSIQAQGIGFVVFDKDGDFPLVDAIGGYSEYGSYATYKESSYEKPYLQWAFIMTNIDGKNREEAYQNATEALHTLSGTPKMNNHLCVYDVHGKGKNDKRIVAVAILTT